MDASYVEGDRLVLRFDDVNAQLAARDAVSEGAAAPVPDRAVAGVRARRAGCAPSACKPMSLGLDLRGGVYFLYEVDVAGAVKQLLASMERDYRTLLRNERIPFTGIADRRRGRRDASTCAAVPTSTAVGCGRCASRTRTSRSTTDTLGEGGSVDASR